MATQTQSEMIDQLVVWEAGVETYYAREEEVIANGQTVALGDILKDNGDGTWQRASAADNVDGIALAALSGDGSTKIAVLERDAVVDHAYVNYQSLTEATVNSTLAAIGILVRTGPTYTTL